MLNISQEHPVSANLFAYCKNNPVNMVDQSGTIAANVIGAVIGGVIGAVGGYFLTRWLADRIGLRAVSYTHLRAHETRHDLVCRLLLEKKKKIRAHETDS